MEQNAPSNRYRFPKSRSKNFKKALGLAEALHGFEEVDGLYWVEPTADERAGKKFQKLVNYSKNWKDAGFFVGDSEVNETDWPQLPEVQSEEQSPAAENEATAPSVAEKPGESSNSEKVESTETVAAISDPPDEPPAAEPKSENKDESKAASKTEPKTEKKPAPQPKEAGAAPSQEAKAGSKKGNTSSDGPAKVEVYASPEEPLPPMAVGAMWVLIIMVLFLLWKITFGSS